MTPPFTSAVRWGVALAALSLLVAGPAAQQPPTQTSSQSEVSLVISGDAPGSRPRLAVPDFLALSNDAETLDAAKTISRVLRDDLNYEREFPLLDASVVATVPPARSMSDVPFPRWRELDVHGVLVGTVQRTAEGIQVEVRLFNVQSGQSAFARQYKTPLANRRLVAHTISDNLHLQQLNLRGVARTKLTFNSDRGGERMANTIENRIARNIYYADYDGENVVQVTAGRFLNIHSTWSPDGRSLVYTSFKTGPPDLWVSRIFEALPPLQLTKNAAENILPAWSPDGTKIAFSSTRAGGPHQIWVMKSDGTNLLQLTRGQFSNTTPTWSPTGAEIAFTCDRAGRPQVCVMSADGLNQRAVTSEPNGADRATWSPAPYNEIAYSAGNGPGQDIKILEVSTGKVRQLTFGQGSNESPAFAPNGKHLAFTSTRAGKEQIFTIAKDGADLRQITRGNSANRQPNWSQGPRD